MIDNFLFQKTIVRHADGTYLILRRSDTAMHKPLEWDLPGGMLDEGESLESGAMREVIEEIGEKVIITKMLLRFTYNMVVEINNSNRNYMMLIYAANAATKDVKLSYEHDLFEWVLADELIARFESQPRNYKAIRYIIDNKLDELA